MDFIKTYMPAYVELSRDAVTGTRERLESYIRVSFPEMDINPNTVVGDLIVTPQAYTLAAIEEGMDRFMSDLNLRNVADGIVYNCDFVEQYLGNFGVDKSASSRASGVVRLLFSKDEELTLDRSVLFQFGDSVFSMYMPNPGPFRILRAGDDGIPGENCTVLRDTGSGSYFADIPLVGNSGTSVVEAGTNGTISEKMMPTLYAITALTNFDSGEETKTLPELARLARDTMYAASLNTRHGAVRYVQSMCPFVDGVFAVKNGDREMLRDYHNPYGVSSGCMDLYVRSKMYDFTEVQPVKLYLNEDTGYYEGEFPYTGQIYHFESVTHSSLQADDLPHVIVSVNNAATASGEASLGPLATYTPYEKLFIVVKNGTDGDGQYIEPQTEPYPSGRKYAIFNMTYQTDSMLGAVASTVENSDHAPVNTSVMVRGFIPVVIDKFEVVYVKRPGVVPLLTEAGNRIRSYLAGVSFEDAFSEAPIAHIMEEAGVKYTKGVNVRARVQWSVADLVGGFDNQGDHSDFSTMIRITDNTLVDEYVGDVMPVTAKVVINSAAGLRVEYPGDGAVPGPFACSIRNIRYYLMEGALTFNEVKEV